MPKKIGKGKAAEDAMKAAIAKRRAESKAALKKQRERAAKERPIEFEPIGLSAGRHTMLIKLDEIIEHVNNLTRVVYEHLDDEGARDSIGYIVEDEDV